MFLYMIFGFVLNKGKKITTEGSANVAVYGQLYGKDYVYASKTVVISTLLSLATLPPVTLSAQFLLGLI